MCLLCFYTHRILLEGYSKHWGEELGIWGTPRKGDFKKNYIVLYLLNVSHIQVL